MRLLLLIIAAGIVGSLVGCELKKRLPGGAVLRPAARAGFEAPLASAAIYTGAARSSAPVIPFQVFGVRYAVDIVLVSKHPDWDMHEYARLDTPDGSVWIAKDADMNGVQTITSDLPNLESWLPEVPVHRISGPLEVEDKSEGRNIDVVLRYANPAGEPVEVHAKGTMPKKPPGKRNGNTMGHSRDIVAVVLDLERFGSKLKAEMRIGDKKWGFRRILGLIPFKFLLAQTQGGFAIADYRLDPEGDAWRLTRPGVPNTSWPTQGESRWEMNDQTLTHDNGICRFAYRFIDGELTQISVAQVGVENETFTLWLNPALPDLRRPFTGVVASELRMDVGGQAGHGTGQVRAQWLDEDTVSLDIVPSKPHWLSDRPLRSIIRYLPDGGVTVRTERVVE
jgi:hypothetical protein